ncbi:MAG TPA: copper resistance CopC family protein [Steroidobacteraceae bacterium]|nr:copper resistance CopC family protein [Steroidobacteraceae bacterium]
MVKHWLLAAVTGVILAGPAFGHAKLRSTIPAADAQLRVAPESLSLSFNEDVRLAQLSLSVGGKAIPVTLDRGAPAAAEVTVKLPALAVGIYQVQWSALSSADGHVTKGSFSFTILGPATARMAAR